MRRSPQLTFDDPALVDVGQILAQGGAALRGVLCHAGGSYGAVGVAAHAKCTEQERLAVVSAAEALRGAGLPCPVVSVCSTPTAHAAQDLSDVTEMRAGVYVFFDLVMARIEACRIDGIALSVMTPVIGHQSARGWTICDAGWMALSRDRGTATQRVGQGYGIVCDILSKPIAGLIVSQANQEHGVIARHPDFEGELPVLSVGTRLRILPNHAYATSAQHGGYHVIPDAPLVQWSRFGGW